MSADSEPAVSPGAPPSPATIVGLVLAAGESSRMGRDKALLEYHGRTFLENIIHTLHEAGIERVVVVLGHHAEVIRQNTDLRGAEVVVNQDYRLGQTSSLQAGLRALEKDEPNAVLLCLVDHPAVSAETLRRLILSFKSTAKPVIIPEMRGKHGHPILVGRELFAELTALGLDQGANTVIRGHRGQTHFVEVSDPGILLDVDDLESYRQLQEQA